MWAGPWPARGGGSSACGCRSDRDLWVGPRLLEPSPLRTGTAPQLSLAQGFRSEATAATPAMAEAAVSDCPSSLRPEGLTRRAPADAQLCSLSFSCLL